MEEILLKSVELGALGIFCLLLLTKGLNALTVLTQAIDKLADKLNATGGRIANIERDVLELKQLVKNFLERKD